MSWGAGARGNPLDFAGGLVCGNMSWYTLPAKARPPSARFQGTRTSRRSSVACKGITSALDFGTISRSTPPAAFFQMSARPPPWARSMIGAVARGTVQPEER